MISLTYAIIKRELSFVTEWYSLDSVKTNNLWKDICIIKIAYAIYLQRNCDFIHALVKAYSIFLRGTFGSHSMSIVPRSFTKDYNMDGILLLRNQYDFLLKRMNEAPSQKRFERFQKDIWKEMDREEELIEYYCTSDKVPDDNSCVAVMFREEEYIRRYFLSQRISIGRLS